MALIPYIQYGKKDLYLDLFQATFHESETTQTGEPMATLPDKDQQIIDAHTGLIHRVVIGCQNRDMVPDLEDILKQAEENGWRQLVGAIRKILAGTQ